MTDENMMIAQRIRAARLQRNLTQQDLADKFGKTSAAISDIERGKTQITAADIIIFSELLIKPIEYFYGEDFGDSGIEDLIALYRKLPLEMRKQQIPMMTLMLRMAEINYKMQTLVDEEEKKKAAEEFFELFMPYYSMIEEVFSKFQGLKGNFESAFQSKNIE